MKQTKLCRWCKKEVATFPIERESIGRLKKEICGTCHSERLKDDLRIILKNRRNIELSNQKEKSEDIIEKDF